tara:strand:- start:4 stop:318 length:315 start_codon:yes stop_codon:yes gene_type:complete
MHLYQSADLFIFPSEYEGFGIPIIEAISNNCPVLASDIEVFKEISSEGINYFTVNNRNSLSDQLDYLLYSSKNLKLENNISINILNKFQWKDCAKQTFEVYKKL